VNRRQRRAAAPNLLTDLTPATMALLGRLAECPDCCADTELVQPSPGVHILEVRHDETCPTYRSMQGGRHD